MQTMFLSTPEVAAHWDINIHGGIQFQKDLVQKKYPNRVTGITGLSY